MLLAYHPERGDAGGEAGPQQVALQVLTLLRLRASSLFSRSGHPSSPTSDRAAGVPMFLRPGEPHWVGGRNATLLHNGRTERPNEHLQSGASVHA